MTILDTRHAELVKQRDERKAKARAELEAFNKEYPATTLICPVCLTGQRMPWKRGKPALCDHRMFRVIMEEVPEGMTGDEWIQRFCARTL